MGRMLFRGWTVSRVGVFVRPRSCPGSAIRGCGAWCGRQAVNRARGLALGYGGDFSGVEGFDGVAELGDRPRSSCVQGGLCGGFQGRLRRHCGSDLVRMVWAKVQTAGGR